MSNSLESIRTRLVDVLCNGRGTSGLGSDAALRAIVADTFRWTKAPLRDPTFDPSSWDRCVAIRWTGTSDGIAPNSSLYPMEEQDITVDVEVGYFQAPAMSGLVHLRPSTSESAANAVLYARERATLDAKLIRRAVGFNDIMNGVLDADGTTIIDVQRVGQHRFEETQDGRLICITPIVILAWLSNTSTESPL